MKKFIFVLTAVVLIAWFAVGADWRRLILNAPTDTEVLFWSVAQRDAAFRMMDRVPVLVTARRIKTSADVQTLDSGEPLVMPFDVDAFMQKNRMASVVVLHNGRVRLEAYNLGFSQNGRWTSFSVAKSFTSTLVGAAIKDGYIKSLDDPVSDYMKGLKGSAYDDVSIEQLLTMSSGVAWNEDYEDPNSDVAKFNNYVATDGLSNVVSYMRSLPREHAPGAVWNYSTGETNMIGLLVQEATGKNLAEYLQEKVWTKIGTQQDASWLLNADGTEISGCCIQAATRDFARFGQFFMNGALVDGRSILPDGWVESATTTRIRYDVAGEGYGYQWWTNDDETYSARGIFGQGIYIDRASGLVVAINSNWRSALGERDGEGVAQDQFFQAVRQAVANN